MIDKSAPQHVCPISDLVPFERDSCTPATALPYSVLLYSFSFSVAQRYPKPITHLVPRLLPSFSFFGSVLSGPSPSSVLTPPETLNCNLRKLHRFICTVRGPILSALSIYSGLWARCCCCAAICLFSAGPPSLPLSSLSSSFLYLGSLSIDGC